MQLKKSEKKTKIQKKKHIKYRTACQINVIGKLINQIEFRMLKSR